MSSFLLVKYIGGITMLCSVCLTLYGTIKLKMLLLFVCVTGYLIECLLVLIFKNLIVLGFVVRKSYKFKIPSFLVFICLITFY